MKIDTLIHIICKFGDSTTRRTEIDDDQSHMTAHDLEVFIITQLLQTEFCMQMQRSCSAAAPPSPALLLQLLQQLRAETGSSQPTVRPVFIWSNTVSSPKSSRGKIWWSLGQSRPAPPTRTTDGPRPPAGPVFASRCGRQSLTFRGERLWHGTVRLCYCCLVAPPPPPMVVLWIEQQLLCIFILYEPFDPEMRVSEERQTQTAQLS